MDDDDASHGHSALGICRCLRMLSDEAASLNLPASAQALRDAIALCERESGLDGAQAVAAISVLLN